MLIYGVILGDFVQILKKIGTKHFLVDNGLMYYWPRREQDEQNEHAEHDKQAEQAEYAEQAEQS